MAWTVYPQCPIRDTEYVGIYVDILVDIKSMWKFFPERFCFGLFCFNIYLFIHLFVCAWS